MSKQDRQIYMQSAIKQSIKKQILEMLSLKQSILQYQRGNKIRDASLYIQSQVLQKKNIQKNLQNKNINKKHNRIDKIQNKQSAKRRYISQKILKKRKQIQLNKKQIISGTQYTFQNKRQKIITRPKTASNRQHIKYSSSNQYFKISSHKKDNNKTQYTQINEINQINNQNKQKIIKFNHIKSRYNIKKTFTQADKQHKQLQKMIMQMTGVQWKKQNKQTQQKQNIDIKLKKRTLSTMQHHDKKQIVDSNDIVIDKVYRQRYKILQLLGKGLSGQAYRGKDILANRDIAIKVIKQSKKQDSEYQFYKKIQHKNIVKYYNTFLQGKNRFLILQYLPFTLKSYLNKKQIQQSDVIKIFKNISQGLLFLHGMSIAHRDIKAENIVCNEDLSKIKFIDFGLCVEVQFCGTQNYMPPQILGKRGYDPKKADIWSLGVLLYKLYFNRYPWKGRDERQMYEKISKCKLIFPQNCNQGLIDLVTNMLKINPKQRFTINQVYNHYWLK